MANEHNVTIRIADPCREETSLCCEHLKVKGGGEGIKELFKKGQGRENTTSEGGGSKAEMNE